MGHVSYTDFRRSLAGHMDRVCDEGVPLTVTRQGGRSVVVMSETEYDAMIETVHLLKSPTNAKRLVEAIDELTAGQGNEHGLLK